MTEFPPAPLRNGDFRSPHTEKRPQTVFENRQELPPVGLSEISFSIAHFPQVLQQGFGNSQKRTRRKLLPEKE